MHNLELLCTCKQIRCIWYNRESLIECNIKKRCKECKQGFCCDKNSASYLLAHIAYGGKAQERGKSKIAWAQYHMGMHAVEGESSLYDQERDGHIILVYDYKAFKFLPYQIYQIDHLNFFRRREIRMVQDAVIPYLFTYYFKNFYKNRAKGVATRSHY